MTFDKVTRTAIEATVRKAVMEAQEVYEERWVPAERLCECVGFFTKNWMDRHGDALPRERMYWTDAKGEHSTRWCYPLKKILRMVNEGAFRDFQVS